VAAPSATAADAGRKFAFARGRTVVNVAPPVTRRPPHPFPALLALSLLAAASRAEAAVADGPATASPGPQDLPDAVWAGAADAPAPAKAPAAADAGQPAAPPPPAAGAEAATPPPPGAGPEAELPAEDSWIDAGHAFIERSLFSSVLQLDRFFSDERDLEPERSRSFLRWRSAVRATQDTAQPALTTGVRATLRLPALNKRLRRLRLVIAGATREALDVPFPSKPSATGTPESAPEDDAFGRADAGLRYFLWDTAAAHVDLGGGAILEMPPGVYGRLRFRWVVPVMRLFLSRTVLIGFWRSDEGFGVSGTLELQRPITRRLVARLAGGSKLSEGSLGVEWSTELALVASLTNRIAAQVAVAVNGATGAEAFATDPVTGLPFAVPASEVERIRAYVRLRRDFYRRWLFFEIEPEIAWPWSPERGRYHAWGGTLRLELQFRGREAHPAIPPPSPPAVPPPSPPAPPPP